MNDKENLFITEPTSKHSKEIKEYDYAIDVPDNIGDNNTIILTDVNQHDCTNNKKTGTKKFKKALDCLRSIHHVISLINQIFPSPLEGFDVMWRTSRWIIKRLRQRSQPRLDT